MHEPEDLGSCLRTGKVSKREQSIRSTELSSDLHMFTVVHVTPFANPHNNNKKIFNVIKRIKVAGVSGACL